MALFTTTIAGAISGSIGGITFSHNKGGAYMRSKVIGTNPNTSFQQVVRQAMGDLANIWANVLTTAQRNSWNTYASLVPVPSKLGGVHIISGIAHFLRSNVPRRQADPAGVVLTVATTAPTINDVGEMQVTSGIVTVPSATVQIAYPAGQDWANETGSAMLIYTGRQQNPSINFFKGPFSLAGAIFGVTGTPVASPQNVTSRFTYSAAKGWFRAQVTRADGRLSFPVILPINFV